MEKLGATCATAVESRVEVDGRIVTSRGLEQLWNSLSRLWSSCLGKRKLLKSLHLWYVFFYQTSLQIHILGTDRVLVSSDHFLVRRYSSVKKVVYVAVCNLILYNGILLMLELQLGTSDVTFFYHYCCDFLESEVCKG